MATRPLASYQCSKLPSSPPLSLCPHQWLLQVFIIRSTAIFSPAVPSMGRSLIQSNPSGILFYSTSPEKWTSAICHPWINLRTPENVNNLAIGIYGAWTKDSQTWTTCHAQDWTRLSIYIFTYERKVSSGTSYMFLVSKRPTQEGKVRGKIEQLKIDVDPNPHNFGLQLH